MGTLVVSPHLDDAVLSAFGLLEGADVEVVNVFTGVPEGARATYWEKLTRARGSVEERNRERLLEDRDALALALPPNA